MAKQQEKDELTIVGPAAEDDDVREESDERAEGGESEEEGQEEERADSEGDERVGHTDDQDDDRTAIRERRRNEKLRKKENRNRERMELNFLRQRNEQLERRQSEFDARLSQGELVSIEGKISELDAQIREAERIKALAINKSDGESAAEADRIARDLSAGRNQLVSIRDQRVQGARTRSTQTQADPEIISAASDWAESHPWYDPNLRNADSRVAKAIEDQIHQEGRLDPRKDEYWNELDRRLKKYMPHRFGNGHNTREDEDDTEDREDVRPERRSKGPRITTGGRERPLRKNEVYISAERKQAMIDANIWDDPVLREKQLKAYQRYDREARNRH